jgi:asparagine synthase (glutamine-hydrolysing)
MPFADWLRGPLRDVLDETVNRQVARSRGLLEPSAVQSVRDRFERQQTGWAEPWLLMMIELWSREVLDRAVGGVRQSEVVTAGALP